MNRMPTVAFHDLVIHPRDGDLVAGTHGRSLWILDDITPLQQLTDKVLAADAHLFKNRPLTIWEDASRGGVRGHMFYAGENPPSIPQRENIVRAKLINGGMINYYLKNSLSEELAIHIADITGENQRTLYASNEVGINKVLWDLRFDPTPQQRQRFKKQMAEFFQVFLKIKDLADSERKWVESRRKEFELAGTADELNKVRSDLVERYRSQRSLREEFGRRNFLPGRLQGKQAQPGEYLVTMSVAGKKYSEKITVRPDPMLDQ
ncbi:MAG: hypothetical protein ACE5G1_14215 [bacterium]